MRHTILSLAFLLVGLTAQPALAINYAAEVLSLNPVAYWRLGESSGAPNAVDEISGNNGNYTNLDPGDFSQPGALAGDPNTAMHFDIDEFIEGSGLPAGTFLGDWTITGWFNRSAQSTWGGIFSASTNGTNRTALLTFIDNNNQLGMNRAGEGGDNVNVDFGGDQHFGEWIFAAVSHTGLDTANNGTLTVTAILDDGTLLQNSGTHAYDLQEDPLGGFYIGHHYHGGFNFDGLIDEVAIFNSELTTQNLQDLWTAGTTVPEPSAFALAALGLACLGLVSRRCRRK